MPRASVAAAGRWQRRPYFQGADWMWRPIPANPVLDSASAAVVTALSSSGVHNLNITEFACNIVHPSEVGPSTPRYDIQFRHAPGGDLYASDPYGPDPFTGYTMAIPDGTETQIPPGDGTYFDGHVAVGDRVAGKAASIWQATASGSPSRIRGASWGGICSLYGDGREDVAVGISTGSGLSRFGCVIRVAEIAAGLIDHALFFGSDIVTLRGSNLEGTNWRYPATTTDGQNQGGGSTTIREGTRVQLNPSVNLAAISGITTVELIVGRALQKYGAYCGDNGGSRMGFIGEYVPGTSVWSNAGATFDYFNMTHIPWSSLRVLAKWDGS